MFFYVVSILVDPDWHQLAAMTAGNRQADVARAETNLSLLIDGHRRDELRRYRVGVVDRVRACRHHVDDTVRRTSAALDTESARVFDVGRSIAAVTAEQYAGSLAAYSTRIDAFTAAFDTKLTAAVGRTMRRYGAYLNSLINNVWLRFAVGVFNSTHQASPPLKHIDDHGLGGQAVAGFGSFLDVDEVKQVEMWVSQFWQR